MKPLNHLEPIGDYICIRFTLQPNNRPAHRQTSQRLLTSQSPALRHFRDSTASPASNGRKHGLRAYDCVDSSSRLPKSILDMRSHSKTASDTRWKSSYREEIYDGVAWDKEVFDREFGAHISMVWAILLADSSFRKISKLLLRFVWFSKYVSLLKINQPYTKRSQVKQWRTVHPLSARSGSIFKLWLIS